VKNTLQKRIKFLWIPRLQLSFCLRSNSFFLYPSSFLLSPTYPILKKDVTSQHPSEVRRKKRWFISFLTLVALSVVFYFTARPIYRKAKVWRVQQLSTQAEALMSKAQWQEAALKAHSAYQLKTDEEAAIRVVARLQSKTGKPAMAVSFWRQLKAIDANTQADDIHYTEDLLKTGLMTDAQQQISEIFAEYPETPENLRLAARVYLSLGQLPLSISYAEKAYEMDAKNEEGRLLLALLQLVSRDEDLSENGKQTLLNIGKNTDKTGLDALTALSMRMDLSPEEMRKVIAGLEAHPDVSEAHRLTILSLKLQIKPDERIVLLEEATSTRISADPMIKKAFAVWLNGQREYERTLAFLPLSEAVTRQDLLLSHLDALSALKRWNDVQQILEGKSIPLEETHKQLFLARSLMEQDDLSKANIHWGHAHAAAAPSMEQTLYLATYAMKIGQTEQAERAYRKLASNSKTARPAYKMLLEFARKRGDTAGLYKILLEMHERWPRDPAISNDYAYFSLLLDKNINTSFEIAKTLVEDAPDSLPHRTTLALAYLKKNAFASALKVYDNLNIPWAKMGTSHYAIYAAVLARNLKENEALKIMANINLNSLRPEERALLPKP